MDDGPNTVKELLISTTYARFAGDAKQTDLTMALKLIAARHHGKAYATKEELLRFGEELRGAARPQAAPEQIGQAVHETLVNARCDQRIPVGLLKRMLPLWRNRYGLRPSGHVPQLDQRHGGRRQPGFQRLGYAMRSALPH